MTTSTKSVGLRRVVVLLALLALCAGYLAMYWPAQRNEQFIKRDNLLLDTVIAQGDLIVDRRTTGPFRCWRISGCGATIRTVLIEPIEGDSCRAAARYARVLGMGEPSSSTASGDCFYRDTSRSFSVVLYPASCPGSTHAERCLLFSTAD